MSFTHLHDIAVPEPVRNGKPVASIGVLCEGCGTGFYRKPYQIRYMLSTGKRAACSRECVNKLNVGSANGMAHKDGPRWQAAKRFVNNERGSKCQICNWAKSLLDVCHITERTNGGPDTPENLLLLCPNHHRQFDSNALDPEEISAAIESMANFGYITSLRKEG